jgi:hypothetical protein
MVPVKIGKVKAIFHLKGVNENLLHLICVYPIWIKFDAADIYKNLLGDSVSLVNFDTLTL